MPFTLTMPKLSPTMEEGHITKWLKKEGDYVEPGEALIEVATDKATVEYSAIDEGWLKKILVSNGGEALVNQAVAIFTEKKEESIEGYQPEGVAPKSAKAKKKEPATAVAAPSTGRAEEREERGAMHQPMFVPEPPLEKFTAPLTSLHRDKRLAASPLSRRLAKEKGLDISTVKGSGPHGRVMSRDLNQAQSDATVAFGRYEMPETAPGSYEEEDLSPMRKLIGKRLQESKTFIPHFYVRLVVNAEPIVVCREQLKEFGVKVTYNDFVMRACALALRQHPHINSGFNSVNQTIIRFQTIDIAVAVSVQDGVITPIVRQADYKNIGQISVEVKELAGRAKEGKLQPEEYRGGSFTISNLGMYGIGDFCAVINPPQAAILAVGGVEERPVVRNGQVVPGKEMTLMLSSDHRVIDGADAAQFLKKVQSYLENPAGLLVN